MSESGKRERLAIRAVGPQRLKPRDSSRQRSLASASGKSEGRRRAQWSAEWTMTFS